MSTYKVIQDIEAEDHILGPLSLRQFIFAIIAVLCFYLCYVVYSKGASFLIALFLPPGLFCAFFAAPFGKDQPTEVWALAKIRFFFKPRKRIWDQSGVKELVSITVPKKIEVRRTDGLSQLEVRSRLSALASTIDSRGWVVKDVDVNLYSRPGLIEPDDQSDRLVNPASMPQAVPFEVVSAADDIMDAQSNPIAQQFDQMINASTQAHHQQLVDMLAHDTPLPTTTQPAPQQDNWFLQQTVPLAPQAPSSAAPPVVSNLPFTGQPSASASAPIDEATLSSQLRARNTADNVSYNHMKTIQPLGHDPAPAAAVVPIPAPAPKPTNPAATQLAANNDLNISTIARVANNQDLSSDEEVIIPLH